MKTKKKNEILGVGYKRGKDETFFNKFGNSIIIRFKGDLPPMGYSIKYLIKMLKKYNKG